MRIEEAIRQKSFRDVREKAGINLLFTASWYSHELLILLKPYGISIQQFNIMRILRGQKGKPAPLRLVTERMIDKMSNTSRLIDKLVAKGLVDRRQCPDDRRQVDLLLTDAGSILLRDASAAIDAGTNRLFDHISDIRLSQFNRMLDEIRGNEQDTTG